MKWFRKGAEQGNENAQYYLGSMYEDGKGVKQDYTDAVKWYSKAAIRGEPAAQLSLGKMYEMGKGVKQDLVQAYMWYSLGGAAYRAALVLDGDYYPDKRIYFMSGMMTQEEIAKAKRLVAEWKPIPSSPNETVH